MRIFVVFLAFFFAIGCAEHSFEEKSTQLQSVYDGAYMLRLSQLDEKPGFYFFETCLLAEGGEVEGGSCVGALEDQKGEDIVFSLEMVEASLEQEDEFTLSDEEKELLIQNHESWREYQLALRRRVLGQVTTGGALFVAGMAAGMVYSSEMRGLAESVKNSAYGALHKVKASVMEQRIVEEQINISKIYKNQNLKHNTWYERFGHLNEAEAEKVLKELEKQLSSRGYPVEEPFKSFLSQAEQSALKGRQHIISDEFFAFLEKQVGEILEKNGQSVLESLRWPVGFFEERANVVMDTYGFGPRRLTWEDLVNIFISERYKGRDILDSKYVSHYLNSNRVNLTFYRDSKSPRTLNELDEAMKSHPSKIFAEASDFVHYGGVPSVPARLKERWMSMKKTFEEGKPHRLSKGVQVALRESQDRLAVSRASFEESSQRIALGKRSIKDMSKNLKFLGKKVGALALLIGSVIGITVYGMNRGVKKAGAHLSEVRAGYDLLQGVLIPLYTPSDEALVKVPSVQKLLENYSLWKKFSQSANIHHYCLPHLEQGALTSRCF